MRKGRDAAEGMASNVIRRQTFLREDIDRHEIIRDALLGQHDAHDPHIHAVASAVHDDHLADIGHHALLSLDPVRQAAPCFARPASCVMTCAAPVRRRSGVG